MTDPHSQYIERRLEFTRLLDPALVERGVLQHFFVSPVRPVKPLHPRDIRAAWQRLRADIRAERTPELLSLYVHIPFCAHRCRYCIYYSVAAEGLDQVETYLKRLHDEIDYYASGLSGVEFCNCYIGGGTPTVLQEAHLEQLLTHLERAFVRKRGGEWSFECNPATVTEAKAELFRDHGFNRVSFGVQSLSPKVLAGVGRGYQTRRQVVETIRIMRRCNFWINVDLIHGLPGQTSTSLLESVEELLALEPTQVTIYGLSPYTPMTLEPDDRESLSQLAPRVNALARTFGYACLDWATCLELNRNSFRPSGGLERSPPRITNLLIAEHKRYGMLGGYNDTTVEPFSLLGLGPTARSYVYGQLQYTSNRDPVDVPWMPDVAQAVGRSLDMDEERRRFVVAGLERPDGLDPVEYEALFGEPLEDHFGQELSCGVERGLLETVQDRIQRKPQEPEARFAATLLFVDDPTLDLALKDLAGAQSGPNASGEDLSGGGDRARAGADLALVLYTHGQEVVVHLTDHWPGRQSYHHKGDFAFFLPSTLPEGSCESGTQNAKLLATFTRVFDRVVVRESPTDLQDLHRLLLARTGR